MHERGPVRLIFVELKSKIRFPEGSGRVHFRGRGGKPIFKVNYCHGLGFNQSLTKFFF